MRGKPEVLTKSWGARFTTSYHVQGPNNQGIPQVANHYIVVLAPTFQEAVEKVLERHADATIYGVSHHGDVNIL